MASGGGSEPNLTPFIDLFSVLICFLLMTAAWMQLESMPTNIEKATVSEADPATPPPEPKKDEKKVSLAISLLKDRVVLKENEKETPMGLEAGDLPKDRIVQVLADWRRRFPEKKDIVLNTEATVFYGDMIQIYDLLIASDWPEVGINPQ